MTDTPRYVLLDSTARRPSRPKVHRIAGDDARGAPNNAK